MATIPIEELEKLSATLLQGVKTLKESQGQDAHKARKIIADAAKQMLWGVMEEDDVALEYCITISEMTCLQQFKKWKLFDKIPTNGSISYKDLAATISADESLISRMGQMLVSTGKLSQPQPSHVAHSRLSPMFASTTTSGAFYGMVFDELLLPCAHFPAFFAKYGPREPGGETLVPKCFCEGADGQLTYFEVIARGGAERLGQFARGYRALEARHPVSGIYDFGWVGEAVERGEVDGERALIVDVGGNMGNCLRRFLEENPKIPAERCVLQDREENISVAIGEQEGDPVMGRVKKQTIDFRMEEPLKGALIYFIRRCLQDYTDADAVNILKNLADALPDPAVEPRARVLICNQILSDPPDPFETSFDLWMLTVGGKDRDEEGFHKIVGEAGMKIVKFHRLDGVGLGVVECVKT